MRRYASWFFWLVLGRVLAMMALLLVEQFCGHPGEACLSDSVWMTVLGSTTVTIVSFRSSPSRRGACSGSDGL